MTSCEYFKNLKSRPINHYDMCLVNPKYQDWRQKYEAEYIRVFGMKRLMSRWQVLENSREQKLYARRYKKKGLVSHIGNFEPVKQNENIKEDIKNETSR